MPDYTDVLAEWRGGDWWDLTTALHEVGYALFAIEDIRRLRSDLAALVEVAAGAVSDETAHDPGVMRLMRHLAAKHPAEADRSEDPEDEYDVEERRAFMALQLRTAAFTDPDEPEPPTVVTSGDMAVELPGIEPDQGVDLMAALERSVAAAKDGRRRRTQSRSTDG